MKRILYFSHHLSTHADMRMPGHKTMHIKRFALRCPEHERSVQQTGQDSAIYFSDSSGKPTFHPI